MGLNDFLNPPTNNSLPPSPPPSPSPSPSPPPPAPTNSLPQRYTGSSGANPWEDINGLGNVSPITQDFITPNSPGEFDPYRPVNTRQYVGGSIQPISLDNKEMLERLAAQTTSELANTRAGMTALKTVASNQADITKEILEGRVAAAQADLKTGQAIGTAVGQMLELAPAWGQLKAGLAMNFRNSGHKQQVGIMQTASHLLNVAQGG